MKLLLRLREVDYKNNSVREGLQNSALNESKPLGNSSNNDEIHGKQSRENESTTEQILDPKPPGIDGNKISLSNVLGGSKSSDLFNVVREACAQHNIKWPAECQVRLDRDPDSNLTEV